MITTEMKNYYSDMNEKQKRWDERAFDFNFNQLKNEQVMPQNIVSFIKDNCKGVSTILDVGGGSGRYALLFAKEFDKIHITDFSKNMLIHAAENAKENNLDNIIFSQVDWENEADINKLDYPYDLVFASMCPAVRNIDGVLKMINLSNNYCILNQFVFSKDSLYDYLAKRFGKNDSDSIKKSKDPHNDREFVNEIFNYLWTEGYNVELKIFEEIKIENLEIDKAVLLYSKRFDWEEDEKELLKKYIDEYAIDGICEVKKESKTALLIWKVNK